MRTKIDKIINQYPVNYSQRIMTAHQDVVDWVEENKLTSSEKFMTKMYTAYYGVSDECSHGNKRNIDTWAGGLKYCGGCTTCACRLEDFRKDGISISKEAAEGQIRKLVNEKPKHFSKMISHRPELYDHVSACYGSTLPEKIYHFLNKNVDVVCGHGNLQKFKTIYDGYVSCGKPDCICINEKRSASCIKSIAAIPKEKKELSKAKRASTNLLKYNHINAGQSDHARAQHKLFYSNPDNVTLAVEKVKKTKAERYGDANYSNIDKIKNHWDSIPAEYWVSRYNNESYLILCDPTQLEKLTKEYSEFEIAEQLNVNVSVVYSWANKFNLRSKYESASEKLLRHKITSLLPSSTKVLCNKRTLIDCRKEIDIYIPSMKTAFEYNGLYWHHDLIPHVSEDYHYKKYADSLSAGFNLVTIFSDIMRLRPSAVMHIVREKLGMNSRSSAIDGCTIFEEYDPLEINQFYENYHFDAISGGDTTICLKNGSDIKAAMTFEQTDARTYELKYYATTGEVSGASKSLLDYFIKKYKTDTIYGYADHSYSNGGFYSKLGFDEVCFSGIDYFYVAGREEIRLSREEFEVIMVNDGYSVDEDFHALAVDRGLLRVWDCGKTLWKLKCR